MLKFGQYAAARGYAFPQNRVDDFQHITAETELHNDVEHISAVDNVSEIEYNFQTLLRNNVLIISNNQLAYREKVNNAFQKFLLEIAGGDENLLDEIVEKLDERVQYFEHTGDIVIQTALAVIEAKGEQIDDV